MVSHDHFLASPPRYRHTERYAERTASLADTTTMRFLMPMTRPEPPRPKLPLPAQEALIIGREGRKKFQTMLVRDHPRY